MKKSSPILLIIWLYLSFYGNNNKGFRKNMINIRYITKEDAFFCLSSKSNGRVHANVVELESGHLVEFMRSHAEDFIYRSESLNNGDIWSEPVPTSLINNNSSITAIKLRSGRAAIVIIYNPTCTPEPSPDLAAWIGIRCPVALALSEQDVIVMGE